MGVSFTQHLLMNCAQRLRLPVPQAAALGLTSLCCVPPPGFKEVTFKFEWGPTDLSSSHVSVMSSCAALATLLNFPELSGSHNPVDALQSLWGLGERESGGLRMARFTGYLTTPLLPTPCSSSGPSQGWWGEAQRMLFLQ